jgi:Flp pilus assembly protein TadG
MPNYASYCISHICSVGRRFATARRALASVEFALSGLALFIFTMAIINLGDLGLTLGALEHGIQAAAREAAIQTSANLAAAQASANPPVNGTDICPTNAEIQTYFNNVAAPTLPPATGSTTDGSPIITQTWVNNALNDTAGAPPIFYLNLNVAYKWNPIGLPELFGSGVNLAVTTVTTVIGPAGMPTC